MSVADLLVSTFTMARAANPKLMERWVTASIAIDSLLPNSLIGTTVQRLGEIDAVCRSSELEMVANPLAENKMDFRFHYNKLMSELWIGTAYSVCFILKDRKLRSDQSFLDLAEVLRMVRVQLEKYELPSDRYLKEPLLMTRVPSHDDELESSAYRYDVHDRHRAHIGRAGVSSRRSMMWEIIDVQNHSSYWAERQDLSDHFLLTFGAAPSAP